MQFSAGKHLQAPERGLEEGAKQQLASLGAAEWQNGASALSVPWGRCWRKVFTKKAVSHMLTLRQVSLAVYIRHLLYAFFLLLSPTLLLNTVLQEKERPELCKRTVG